MAIRNIVQVGDEVLRKVSAPVKDFDEKLDELVSDLYDTMENADGAGLAAVQVGVLKRVFVVHVGEDFYEFINPKILSLRGTQTGTEGCLSIKGRFGTVTRAMKVNIKAFNREGKEFRLKANGLLARAIQHEYDHLDGILYTDKASEMEQEEV